MAWLVPILAALFAVGGLHGSTVRMTHLAHSAWPAHGRMIAVDSTPTHVIDRGEGPPLVLLHGIGGSVHVWPDTVLSTISAAGYRVIAVDRPGHGHSVRPAGMSGDPREQAEFLAATLDELAVDEPVTLLGQSWGASVAVAFALAHPERVRTLLFVNPYLHAGHDHFTPAFDLAELPGLSDLVFETIATPFSQAPRQEFARLLFHPDPVPPGETDGVLLSQTPAHMRISAADMRTIGPALRALRPRLGELRMPVTLLVGLEDALVDPSDALALADRHGWRVVPFTATGHALERVRTGRFLEEIFAGLPLAATASR